MGVYLVRRGKAEYLYLKNKVDRKYVRITDAQGNRLKDAQKIHRELLNKDKAITNGSGTKHLYLVCASNAKYGYKKLVFRAQPPGHKSKTFDVSKLGYVTAYIEAEKYLNQLGFETRGLPNPSTYRDLIVRVLGELGYRTISKEYRYVRK